MGRSKIDKPTPDRVRVLRWIKAAGFTNRKLAAEIARIAGVALDETQFSRRMKGINQFSLKEMVVMAKLIGVPERDLTSALTGALAPPIAGSIHDEGRVTFHGASREKEQTLAFKTADALEAAVLTVKMCAANTQTAPRGVYVVRLSSGDTVLRQVFGRIAGAWIVAPLFGAQGAEQVDKLTFVAKAAYLQF